MSDLRRAEDRVGEYWDALVLGQESAATGLEPGLAQAIERVQHPAIQPPATARERVRRHLASQMASRQSLQEDLMHPVIALSDPRPAPIAPKRRPYLAAWTLAAMCVVTALLLVTGFFESGRPPASLPPGDPAPAMLSALEEAPPGAAADDGTVLVVPLAAEPETFKDITNWLMYAITVEPGARAEWKENVANTCCPGPRLEYVVSGEMTFRSGQPTQVMRANGAGAVEAIAAGAEVTLHPGDARISRNETPFEAVNSGAVRAEMVLSTMIFDSGDVEPVPTGWVTPSGLWESVDLNSVARDLSPSNLGDYQMRLRRIELAPDDVAAPPSTATTQVGVALDPEAPLGRPGGGALRNMGGTPITVYVLYLEPRNPVAVGAGTPAP
ncbi:MAG: hypothetical protein QM692_19765 [Thermomicrobiales bacterium]